MNSIQMRIKGMETDEGRKRCGDAIRELDDAIQNVACTIRQEEDLVVSILRALSRGDVVQPSDFGEQEEFTFAADEIERSIRQWDLASNALIAAGAGKPEVSEKSNDL